LLFIRVDSQRRTGRQDDVQLEYDSMSNSNTIQNFIYGKEIEGLTARDHIAARHELAQKLGCSVGLKMKE
jgi:hypothetical protein